LKGNPYEVWKKLITGLEVKHVFLNKDYEPYAIQRDKQIKELISEKGIGFHSFKDQVIFEEAEIMKTDGTPYTIFTPYKNKWLEKYTQLSEDIFDSSYFNNCIDSLSFFRHLKV
jgi:deoxyribodipyrimidine photo-lyase